MFFKFKEYNKFIKKKNLFHKKPYNLPEERKRSKRATYSTTLVITPYRYSVYTTLKNGRVS